MRSHRATTTRLPRSPNAAGLIRLARALADSGNHIEDEFWSAQMAAELKRILQQGSDAPIHAALEFLWDSDMGGEDNTLRSRNSAYEALAAHIEAACESTMLEIENRPHAVLLIACPVMAWSRAVIAAGKIRPDTLQALHTQLQAHVLADGVRLTLVESLFSPDQMPEGYASIYRMTKKASQALAAGSLSVSKPEDWPEALPFLADSRFVVGAIAAPEGAPLFRWQTISATPQIKRSDCIEEWKTRGSVALANMLSNCAYEMVEPGAFFSSTRATEREIRSFSLKASVSFLHMSLDLAPPAQQAVVARCQDGEFEEYRIGFCKLGQTQVLHGAIWPLLGPELDNPEEPNEIETALRLAGISSIIHIDTLLPAEFCSDCGVPLYPNPEGELLHAEVSAEAENSESSVHQALH